MRALFVMLAACGAAPARSPVLEGHGSAPPPAPSATCAATGEERADSIAVTAEAIRFCLAGEPRSCWKYAWADGAVSGQPVTPAVETSHEATARSDGKTIELCSASGACKKVPNPTGATAYITVDDALTTFAIVDHNADVVRVFDAASGRVRATIRGWVSTTSMPPSMNLATFVGGRLVVWRSATPVASIGRVFDYDGKLLMEIGRPDDWAQSEVAWPLGGSEWGFVAWGGSAVAVADFATNHVTTYSLSGTWSDYQAIVSVSANRDKIVLVSASPPGIAVVHRRTRQAQYVAVPVCGQEVE